LNRYYYNSSSSTDNSFLIGSWAKHTRIRPPRDIDLVFVLPDDVYLRYENRVGNKQSQLLQEVRDVLRASYPRTDIRGDGPVVGVGFGSFDVEVVPSFKLSSG
jgi:tRNA nucleotidyltransferase (CCA-adding enzyme)